MKAEAGADAAAVGRGETPPERPLGRPIKPEDWYLADIEEDNAYVERCRNDHEMRMTLQSIRYELLFESGIVATLVGFHREAVSSIAASLERFFEFAIDVFTVRAGVKPDVHAVAWKQLKKFSERQFGAFLLLYLVNVGEPFMTGKDVSTYESWVSFRNEIIHQGRFPSQKEALDYARYVYDLIRALRARLVVLDPDTVQKVELMHSARGHAAIVAKAGEPKRGEDGMYRGASSASFPTMLKPLMADVPLDFDSRLAATGDNLSLWGFPRQR